VVNASSGPLYSRERDPVPFLREAGWVPLSVWTGTENLSPPPGFDPLTIPSVIDETEIKI